MSTEPKIHEDGFAIAQQVGITTCFTRGCTCENVFIQLFDTNQEIFAVAPISAQAALDLGMQLITIAKKQIGGNA